MKATADKRKSYPVHIVRNLEGETFCGKRGVVVTEDEAEHSTEDGRKALCLDCLRELEK